MAVTLCNWIWRVLIGGTFLLAAYAKLRDGMSYLPPETIYDRIVAFSPWRHYAILGMETVIGLWVLSSIRTRWASLAAGLMVIAFCALLSAELIKESPSNCGCGIRQVYPDGDPRSNLIAGLVRNAFLLLGALWLYFVGEEAPATPPVTAPSEPDKPAHNDTPQA